MRTLPLQIEPHHRIAFLTLQREEQHKRCRKIGEADQRDYLALPVMEGARGRYGLMEQVRTVTGLPVICVAGMFIAFRRAA